MNNLLDQFKSFFFWKISRYQLEFLRIFFYSALFIIYSLQVPDAALFTPLKPEYWGPTGLFVLTPFLKPPLNLPSALYYIWLATFAFCAIGALTSIMKWACLILSCFFIGYSSNFFLYPVENLFAIFCLLFLCFTDIGESASLDRITWKKNVVGPMAEAWAIRFLQVALIAFWLGSAVQKLRISGLDWFMKNHVASYLRMSGIDVPDFLVQFSLLLTLVAELLSPLVFLKKMRFLLIILFLFHLGTLYLIKIPIYVCLVSFVFWLPLCFPGLTHRGER